MHWAAHLYRLAVRNLRPIQPRHKRRSSLRLESLEIRAVPHITGTVFNDLNQDGVQDPEDLGVAGVVVRATDETGATSETTTGDDGTYELESDAATLRLAFSGFPDGTMPGRVIGTSGPVVRFITPDSQRTDQNLSLATPTLVTTQFFYDRALDGANSAEGAVLVVPYGAQDTVFPTPLATVADVGSVWGVAYQPASNSIYVSSFLKRHAGLGPNAAGTGTTTGGIYRIDRSTDPATVSLMVDLNASGAALATGADPHPALAESDGGNWFHDAATLPLVGKRGLGGLQVSADGTTLYTVNLNTRELIQIPINPDGTLDTSRSLAHTPIPLTNPAGSGIIAFNAANLRPFAVAVKGTTVYVGVTYTVETGGGSAADLRAFVYAFNPTTGSFNPTPVLSARLNYPRGIADDPTPDDVPGDEISANWRPWISSFDTSSGQEGFPVHPQPWLTDIVFDGDTMVVGIRDRFGDQGGFQTGNTNSADDSQFSVIAAGDILRATPNGSGGWQLESGGTAGGVSTPGAGDDQGPGGGEFYVDSAEGGPQEVGTGGLAQVPGFHTVAATANDPITTFSGGIDTFLNSDTDPTATSNAGTAATHGELYSSFDQNTFGNANGLGDLEALPTIGTVEAGDRVFADANSNGIQDANEPGIAGVAIGLYRGSTLVGTQTTDAKGDFLFSDLTPNVPYSLQVNMAQPAIGGRSLAQANKGTDDEIDSDATLNGTTAKLDFTSPSEGSSIHSLDVGIAGPVSAAGVLTLGDTVFKDANNDGTFGAGETGVAGVTVELLDSTGATVLATTTTDASGVYSFTSLDPGTYVVRLAASNFTGTGALVGFTASTTSSSDPNDDVNNDSNGAASGTLGSGGVILSGPITLADGAEPINDGDTDANTNLTLDFGVVPPAAAATLTLGNQVWTDTNNNGTLDSGETGVNGVTVQLISSTGTVLQTTTTAGGGLYTFANLAAGDYRVRLPEANFQAGGALVGRTSSTFTSADANDNVNNNDDGAVTGTLGQTGGFIQSGLITLSAGNEPTNDGDTSADTNLSLDFGIVPTASATLTLGNTVWNDVNNNGLLDSGESGIAGVSVHLLNAAGAIVQQAITNASGQYSFAGLAAGDYRVRLAASNFTGSGPLVGFTSSTGTNGSATGAFEGAGTPDPDSNADNDDNGQVTGTLGQAGGFIQSGLITLAAGTEPTNDGDTSSDTNLTLDFGVFRKFSVGNLVFKDLNNNGTRDTGEPGLPNVSIRLLNADLSFALVGTTTTNAQGQYLFTNLIAGNYAVDVAASNFNSGGVLASFKSSTGLNNAFEPAPSNATDNQDHGSTTGPLGSGGSVQSQTIAIGPGMPTGESPNNDANTPDNQSNLTVDFGMFQQTPTGAGISGRVFLDYNNSGAFNGPDTGITGVTITLSGANLTTPITVQTDAQGNFTFTNLAAGTYTLTETQPTTPPNQNGKDKAGSAGGSTATANTISNIVVAANEQATGYTFAEVPIVSTGGTVFQDRNGNGQKDAGEPGISAVIITLTGTSVVTGTIQSRKVLTDPSGNYSFTDLTPGTYNIVETQPDGFVDGKEQNGTPAAATVTNDHFTGINLAATAAPSGGFNFGETTAASIAGVVYDDVNDDGAQGTGEAGIAGVKVTLTGTNDLGQAVSKTTTTGVDGSYSFTGLRPGTYSVVETQLSLYRDGKDTAGTSGGNATAVNDHITGIVLASGATATGYLFGEHGTADVIVTMTPASKTIAPGGQVTITYTVKNRGTAIANAVAVALTYGGLSFVSSNSTNFDNTTKKWTVGDLAAGATQTITVTFRAPAAGGTFGPGAHATTTSTELSTANNSDSSTVFAGVTPPPQPTGGSGGSLWFLSSSTNAHKIPR